MLMHIATCLNYFDLNKTVASKRLISYKFSHKFSSDLSIALVQNISVLDKSRKPVSSIRVDYENKTQMLLNPQLKFTCVLNRTLFSDANYLRKHEDTFRTFFY